MWNEVVSFSFMEFQAIHDRDVISVLRMGMGWHIKMDIEIGQGFVL